MWEHLLVFAVVMGLFGLLALAILWPTSRSGRRLLTRWDVPEPTRDEVDDAVRYLRRRRFWYPWLYFALAWTIDDTHLKGPEAGWRAPYLLVLLFGALIAEVLALRPARSRRRVAVLRPRQLSDLVPTWALALLGIVAGVALVLCVASLAGVPWARHWMLDVRFSVVALVVTVVSVPVVALVVRLALRRPADGDPRVDAALRARSARVAVGLGIGTLGALLSGPTATVGWIVLVIALAGWIAVVSPARPARVRVP
ncbi:MAG TPA: hypothetical protein VHF06_36385 [Pseudonocardiaceae bacterium]|nr:hypothetical protein [Pseudonocardiaceae bacterium]